MKNLNRQETKITPDLPSQTRQQSLDLRFCRAWWEYKKALYPKLGNAALRVFLVLEDRASRWNNYHVPMSLATLGEETGVKHHTTLASGIRELEAAGIIAVTRHVGNSRQANIYALLIRELIGDEQQTSSSSSNSPHGCDCEQGCQQVSGAKTGMRQGSDNCTKSNSDVNYSSNRKESNATPSYKAAVNATISSNQSSHAISAASVTTTSAENELLPTLESAFADSGSAKTDSVLSCTNTNSTNRINWFNPNGLNGVPAAKNQPVKDKLGQSQNQEEHALVSAAQPTLADLVTPVAYQEKIQAQYAALSNQARQGEHGGQPVNQTPIAAANPVQVQLQDAATEVDFEPKSWFNQYPSRPQVHAKKQNHNIQQLQEEYFKKLSWTTNTRERMAVVFSVLRMVVGCELEKAEFSGIQALVNEYGCKAVLDGILATLNRAVDRQAYFAYLRGVIRRQGKAALVTGDSYHTSIPAQANSPRGYRRQLPIDLAKYTGSGKYAHIVSG